MVVHCQSIGLVLYLPKDTIQVQQDQIWMCMSTKLIIANYHHFVLLLEVSFVSTQKIHAPVIHYD